MTIAKEERSFTLMLSQGKTFFLFSEAVPITEEAVEVIF